ncbi:MAG: hypothetical protein RLN70_08245 [Rhodospirillaceae bacterium]
MQRNPAFKRPDIAYGVLIAALSAAYYLVYLSSGYNFSDEGNFAQLCYELLLGRDPADLTINYGILWFKAGEALFHVFGVEFVVVRLFFFTCIVITNVLIFYTVALATGSRPIGALAAIVPAVVPAFPPTAFYALCTMLNAAAQMRLAGSDAKFRHAAIAGAALSISFLIRPDFGYAFTLPLIAVLFLSSFAAAQEGRAASPWTALRTPLLSAVAGFLVVQAIAVSLAATGGYATVLLHQYFQYPAMMAQYLFGGLEQLFLPLDAATQEAGALLRRPLVSDIFSGTTYEALFAVLVYLPLVMLPGFAVLSAVTFLRGKGASRVRELAQDLVVFSAAAVALPHYFFYRPDLSHVANFMPGYVILLTVFVWRAYQRARRSGTSLRLALPVVGTVAAVNLLAFLWLGLSVPGTGSVAGHWSRTEHFQAGNGVEVRVNPGEAADLRFMRDFILKHSGPADRIVCLPYCPGIAFMAERRMLFREFYVDDSTPLRQPHWIKEAIQATRAARPSVVIIMDWAINGTEKSRFSNWAAPYVGVLDQLADESETRGIITAYAL